MERRKIEAAVPGFQANGRLIEILFVLACFILINGLSLKYQGGLSVGGGRGWDGCDYYDEAVQIASGQSIHCPANAKAWYYRLGTPFLAAILFPKNLLASFLAVNILANLLTVLLLAIWFGLWIKDWRIRVLLNLLFQAQWSFPVRFVWFYPVLTDNWSLVFILASLVLVKINGGARQTSFMLALLSFIGTFFRETVLPVTLIYLFIPWSKKEAPPARGIPSLFYRGLPLAGSLASLCLQHRIVHLVPTTVDYSYFRVLLDLLVSKSFATWLLGWLTTFGPILIIILLDWKQHLLFFRKERHYFVTFLGYSLLTYYGYETERYLAPVAAFIYLFIGLSIEKKAVLFQKTAGVVLILCLQAFSHRIFWAIPDYSPIPHKPNWAIFLAPTGPDTSFFDLLAYFMSPTVRVALWFEYWAVAGVLILMHYYFQRGRSKVLPTRAG